MLANTENIEISSGEEGPTHPMEGALDRLTMAMDQFTLSLLSTTRHHEQLSDFQVGVFSKNFLPSSLISLTLSGTGSESAGPFSEPTSVQEAASARFPTPARFTG